MQLKLKNLNDLSEAKQQHLVNEYKLLMNKQIHIEDYCESIVEAFNLPQYVLDCMPDIEQIPEYDTVMAHYNKIDADIQELAEYDVIKDFTQGNAVNQQ